jgi:hypothetical protein
MPELLKYRFLALLVSDGLDNCMHVFFWSKLRRIDRDVVITPGMYPILNMRTTFSYLPVTSPHLTTLNLFKGAKNTDIEYPESRQKTYQVIKPFLEFDNMLYKQPIV